MIFGIWSYKFNEIYAFRLTAPWFSAYEAINAMRFTRLDWREVHSGHILTPGNEHAQNEPVDSFWPYLVPGCQNAQNKTPGAHSSHISHQVTKMLKMSFLRLILAISAPGSKIYVFRLAAPWFSAFEAINARGFMHLDWQLHGVRHSKL